MNPKSIPSSELLYAMRWRYATKAFDANRKISGDVWSALEDSLVLSPRRSVCNRTGSWATLRPGARADQHPPKKRARTKANLSIVTHPKGNPSLRDHQF